MEQFDTLPIQCRHIEHMHEGVYNFCLHRFYLNLRLLVQTITCQVFSLTLTVRGVSNKHCLLTFFIIIVTLSGILYSVEGDPMVWPHPQNVILYARSSYYFNDMFIV